MPRSMKIRWFLLDGNHIPSVPQVGVSLIVQAIFLASQRDIDFAFMLGQLNVHISPVIREALSQSRNITSLYSHQAESINALCSGKNVIVTTSTARLVTIAELCIIFSI
jgi:hypothetical protein